MQVALQQSGINACKWKPKPFHLDEVANFLRDPHNATGMTSLHRTVHECAALSDMPWWAIGPALIAAFPSSRFILTRWGDGCDRWLHSTRSLFDYMQRQSLRYRGLEWSHSWMAAWHRCVFGSATLTNASSASFRDRCVEHERAVVLTAQRMNVPLLVLANELPDDRKWVALDEFLGTQENVSAARRRRYGNKWPHVTHTDTLVLPDNPRPAHPVDPNVELFVASPTARSMVGERGRALAETSTITSIDHAPSCPAVHAFDGRNLPYMWIPGLPVPFEPAPADYYRNSPRIEIAHQQLMVSHAIRPGEPGEAGMWLYAANGSGTWWDPGRRLVKHNMIDAVIHFNSLDAVIQRYTDTEARINSPARGHVRRWRLALGNLSWSDTLQLAANGTGCFGHLAMATMLVKNMMPMISGFGGMDLGEKRANELKRKSLIQKHGVDSLIMYQQTHLWPRPHDSFRRQFSEAGDLITQCIAGQRHPRLFKIPEIIDFRHIRSSSESLLRSHATASADGTQPCDITPSSPICTSCSRPGHVLCACVWPGRSPEKIHRCCLEGGPDAGKLSTLLHNISAQALFKMSQAQNG